MFSDFDPTWDLEEAKKHDRGDWGPHNPYARWSYWRLVEIDARACYESGDRAALIFAIECCATFELPLPGWTSPLVVDACRAWRRFEARTLDEAFGVERPSGFRLVEAGAKASLAFEVFQLLWAAKKNGDAIDQDLFEEIAEKLNVSASSAKRAYYSEQNSLFRKFVNQLPS